MSAVRADSCCTRGMFGSLVVFLEEIVVEEMFDIEDENSF